MPVLAVAAAAAALAWVYLLAAHGGYWRTDQRLPPGARAVLLDIAPAGAVGVPSLVNAITF